MDLDLAPDHVLLRDTIREFMTEEVAPLVDEHEKARRFPTEVVRRIGELGWLGINVPERWGGAGMDTLAYAIAVEEIGRVWGSLGLIVAAHTSLGCGPLLIAGTDEQRDRFLPPLASGADARRVRADGADGAARTPAARGRRPPGRDGEDWVIDGQKRFITNAGQAGLYILTARTGTNDDGSARDLRVHRPAGQPGLRRRAGSRRRWASTRRATGELQLDGVRVPAANLLGERGRGLQVVPQGARRRADLDRARSRSGSPRRRSTRPSRTRRRGSSSAGRSARSRASRS